MELDDNCHPSNACIFLLMNGMYTIGGLLHHVVYYRVDGQHCDQSTELEKMGLRERRENTRWHQLTKCVADQDLDSQNSRFEQIFEPQRLHWTRETWV